ncbi:MAG: hypothetical protein O3C34_14400 [Proteobacteria bacterium]|nr:hypothetical protein [Pseudomonadota bacterium]
MSLKTINWRTLSAVFSAAILLAGCSSTLIEDAKRPVSQKVAHCEGSETVNDSSIAVLPIPIVAFFVPHMDVNEIRGDDYVKRCGDQRNLVNRQVKVSRTACVPAALTRFLTLGVWQWCPASVSWEADVMDGGSATSKASE